MPKFVVIDDDPTFGNIMARYGRRRGADVDYFGSLGEMGAAHSLRRYDAAIVDFDLGGMTGIDVAQHLKMAPREVPMVLVSSEPRINDRSNPWPSTVRAFVRKSSGFEAVFAAVMAVLASDQRSTGGDSLAG